jgi:DNA-binding response OmpR family regulator
MERLLARENWAVMTASHAEAAHVAAAATPPRVAVIDLGLPGGGVSLASDLREAHPEVGLLFVSGAPPSPEDQAYIDSTDARFLRKPFAPESLVSTVADAAGSAG